MSAEPLALDRQALVRQPQHRQARGEHRRAALLHALEAQLQERALADISVASITREAGVARSAFYFYFPSKNAAVAELQWFLTEQVEEEKTAREIVARFKMVGNDAASLLDLDRELGARSDVEAAAQKS